jgi:hypothetical protein
MSAFIQIGDTRIRKTNIKDWGVYKRSKRFKLHNAGLFHHFWESFFNTDVPHEYKDIQFLRISTYQDDTFDFDEDEFDIWPVVNELKDSL